MDALQRTLEPERFQSFVSAQKTWNPGTVITVAFKGGSNEVRRQIADAITPWSEAANVTFDFGYSQQTESYREWSATDNAYRASVRISFNSGSEYGTYWSAIGRESVTASKYKPNESSMNFGNFAEGLPETWQATVLHEFGHALGFMHEHQSPNSNCEQEYRWDDDPGYVPLQDAFGQFVPNQGKSPGLYTVLGGPQNWWTKAQIDFNLKKFANSVGWKLSPFDRDSIMKYHFDGWMYRDVAVSTNSGCYSPENRTLSSQDRKAASEIYPRNPSDIQSMINQRLKVSTDILKLHVLAPEVELQVKHNIQAMKQQ